MRRFDRICKPGIVYGSAAGESLELDLYLPVPAKNESGPAPPRPIIAYFHGGGWVSGSRGGPSAVSFALEMAAEGLAVACVGYRLGSAHPAPAAILDCRLAVGWLRAHAAENGLDPERIVVMGNSAGGHLAAMVGLIRSADRLGSIHLDGGSERVQAVVSLCGISDVEVLVGGDCSKPWAEAWIPAHLADRAGLARQCSPLRHVRSDAPPFLLIHGDADSHVPYDQAVRLHDGLKAMGAPSELATLRGADHFLGIMGPPWVQRAVRRARRRFFRRLGLYDAAHDEAA